MNSYNKISIVTPSYNQGNFIQQTIDSILNQNYPNLEYIIIDGGSTDNTIDILRSYDQKIKWISEKDNGQSDAINKGLRMTTGDIIAYLNSDDLYTNHCLFTINNFFQKNPQSMWTYGRCRIIDENNKEIRKYITAYKNIWMKNFNYNKLLILNSVNQPATFWKKQIHQEFGFFNEEEHLVMDYEFWLRIGNKYPAGFIRDYVADFRMHTQSKSFMRFQEQFRDELRLAKKYSSKRWPIALHYVNYASILLGYKLLQRFS